MAAQHLIRVRGLIVSFAGHELADLKEAVTRFKLQAEL